LVAGSNPVSRSNRINNLALFPAGVFGGGLTLIWHSSLMAVIRLSRFGWAEAVAVEADGSEVPGSHWKLSDEGVRAQVRQAAKVAV
jgi:hypothetical protein